jgi:hypothetical protein
MDNRKLLEYLKNFCECVDSYLTKYEYAIRTIRNGHNPTVLGTLSSLIYGAHLQVLAFGANLTTELYYRGMDESGNIVQGTMDHVLNRRIGYEALRCEWPQWKTVLDRIARTDHETVGEPQQVYSS